MDSRAWLAHLEQFGIKLGLDTITAIVEALGHPERACPVLHVAGTNGKGSVSAMASHALTSSGLVTARYTSPHLVRLEERFAVDGRSVPAASLDTALDQVRSAVAAAAVGRDPEGRADVLRGHDGRRVRAVPGGACGTRGDRGRAGRAIRRDQHRRAAGDGDHLGGLRSPGTVGDDAGGDREREGGHDQTGSARGHRAARERGARGRRGGRT